MVDGQIESYLDIFGAVCVEGPKFCGKTWASRTHCNSEFSLGSSQGNFLNRRLVEADVNSALGGEEPHLIDEWQDVPSIWDAVRMEVDRVGRRGRFVLTGSSTPRREGIMHSGAGRIGKIRMRTMSLFESGDSDGTVSLSSLFDGNFGTSVRGNPPGLGRLVDLTVRGGWPQHIGLGPEDAQKALRSYMELVANDACSLDGRSLSMERMRMVLRSLARNESTVASDATIIRDIARYDDYSPDPKTLDVYWDALDRLFLIDDQPSFTPGYRSPVRVGKAPKRHLADPALAIAALGMTKEMLMSDPNTFGFMFEAMCERDLDVYAQVNGGRLRHYRDAAGREIDAVVEMPDGRWGAFEIKLGHHQVDSAAEGLLKISDYMEGRGARVPSVLAVVCGTDSAAYRRKDGVYVVPITSLRA